MSLLVIITLPCMTVTPSHLPRNKNAGRKVPLLASYLRRLESHFHTAVILLHYLHLKIDVGWRLYQSSPLYSMRLWVVMILDL